MQKSCVQFNTYGEITALFIVLFLSITPTPPQQATHPRTLSVQYTTAIWQNQNCTLEYSSFLLLKSGPISE